MKKPRKAYLVESSHTGFGFRVSPVIVLDHAPGDEFAHVALLNVSERSAWVPSLGVGIPVPVERLASTRLRALAKIALYLRDLDGELTAHFAIPPPVAPKPASAAMTTAAGSQPKPAGPTPGGPRRERRPWYVET